MNKIKNISNYFASIASDFNAATSEDKIYLLEKLFDNIEKISKYFDVELHYIDDPITGIVLTNVFVGYLAKPQIHSLVSEDNKNCCVILWKAN